MGTHLQLNVPCAYRRHTLVQHDIYAPLCKGCKAFLLQHSLKHWQDRVGA